MKRKKRLKIGEKKRGDNGMKGEIRRRNRGKEEENSKY